MSVYYVIVVFSLIWWLVFLMALPIGIEVGKLMVPGQASSAPDNPRIWLKVIVTTILTIALTFLYFYLMKKGYLDFLSEHISLLPSGKIKVGQ